jgi:hypothetical protein
MSMLHLQTAELLVHHDTDTFNYTQNHHSKATVLH